MFEPETGYKVIVIDTEQYAGNFEREMCAFITGQYGECEVGKEIAESASECIGHLGWWEENIADETDDRDVRRPASIWPTPGWFNDGMGGHHKDVPENYEAARGRSVEKYKEYMEKSMANALDRLERGDFEDPGPGAWTKEACEQTVLRTREQIENYANAPLGKAPAYLSVAIFVHEFPPREVLDEIVERASEFASDPVKATGDAAISKKPVTITGFRMLDPTNDFSEEFGDVEKAPAL
jgi:hypothetical protein